MDISYYIKHAYLILLLGFALPMSGQELIFSQFYNAPLNLNPAFAGTSSQGILNLNSRVQWPGLGSPYKSFSLGYNQYFDNLNSGLGFFANGDDSGSGILKHIDLGIAYMYRMQLTRKLQARIGLEAGIEQFSLNWDKLIFADQIDPFRGPTFVNGSLIPSEEIRPDKLRSTNVDLGMGLLLFTELWYAGVSLKHINNPNFGFIESNNDLQQGIPILVNVHVGAQILLDRGNNRTKATFLSPSVILAKQGDFYQVNGGVHAQIRNLLLGVHLRHTLGNIDASILSFGYTLDKLKISYSFDLTLSSLGLSSGGSHEVGILYNLGRIGKEKSKLNDCFMLFR